MIINIPNRLRYILLDVFENQQIQISNFDVAQQYNEAFQCLIGNISWPPENDTIDVQGTYDMQLNDVSAHIILGQLTNMFNEETAYRGGDIRGIVSIVQDIKKHMQGPDPIRELPEATRDGEPYFGQYHQKDR